MNISLGITIFQFLVLCSNFYNIYSTHESEQLLFSSQFWKGTLIAFIDSAVMLQCPLSYEVLERIFLHTSADKKNISFCHYHMASFSDFIMAGFIIFLSIHFSHLFFR